MLRRPSPAMIVGLLALLVAMSGTAVADPAFTAAKRLVTGKSIKDGTIQVRDLAPAARRALAGATGPAGPSGPAGPAGPAGSAGEPGAQGPAGPRGAEGPEGKQGLKGDEGEDGEDGEDGDDASILGETAGGDLSGTYPNPQIAAGAIDPDTFSTTAFPKIRATSTGTQSVANTASAFVRLQSHPELRSFAHDTGTVNANTCETPDQTPGDCFVRPTRDGTYLITGQVRWQASAAAGYRRLQIQRWTSGLNAVSVLAEDTRSPAVPVSGTIPTTQSVSTVRSLSVSNWVTMSVLQDSGAARNLEGGTDDAVNLTLTWLGP